MELSVCDVATGAADATCTEFSSTERLNRSKHSVVPPDNRHALLPAEWATTAVRRRCPDPHVAQPGSASVQDVVGGHGDAVLERDAIAESSRRLRDRIVVHGTVDGGREALR